MDVILTPTELDNIDAMLARPDAYCSCHWRDYAELLIPSLRLAWEEKEHRESWALGQMLTDDRRYAMGWEKGAATERALITSVIQQVLDRHNTVHADPQIKERALYQGLDAAVVRKVLERLLQIMRARDA